MARKITTKGPVTSRATRLLDEFQEATRKELSSAAGLAAALEHIAFNFSDPSASSVPVSLLKQLAVELTGKRSVDLPTKKLDLINLD